MVAIERVAAAGVVHVILPGRCNKEVITAIIDTSETERWSLMVAFIGVIKDYVKDYLDALFVKCLYRIEELLQMHAVFRPDAVRGLRGKIAHRAVAPEIPEGLAIDYSQGHGFVEIKNRQQFHSGNAKFLQVRDFLYESQKGAGVVNF